MQQQHQQMQYMLEQQQQMQNVLQQQNFHHQVPIKNENENFVANPNHAVHPQNVHAPNLGQWNVKWVKEIDIVKKMSLIH